VKDLQIKNVDASQLDSSLLDHIFDSVDLYLNSINPHCECHIVLGSWYIHPSLKHCYFSFRRIPYCLIHERQKLKSIFIIRIETDADGKSEYHLVSSSYDDLNEITELIQLDDLTCKGLGILKRKPREFGRSPTYQLPIIEIPKNEKSLGL